jgi:hypothetical protein
MRTGMVAADSDTYENQLKGNLNCSGTYMDIHIVGYQKNNVRP